MNTMVKTEEATKAAPSRRREPEVPSETGGEGELRKGLFPHKTTNECGLNTTQKNKGRR